MLACGMEVEIDAASFGFKMKCRMVSIAFSGVLRSPAAKEKGRGRPGLFKVEMQFFPVIPQVYGKLDFTTYEKSKKPKGHVHRNSQHLVDCVKWKNLIQQGPG
jgi:hypothetical protein